MGSKCYLTQPSGHQTWYLSVKLSSWQCTLSLKLRRQKEGMVRGFFLENTKQAILRGSICRNGRQHFIHRGVKMPECQLKLPIPGGSIVRNRGAIKFGIYSTIRDMDRQYFLIDVFNYFTLPQIFSKILFTLQ
jgi:hypothetical protein